ncbi:integrase core domain-containing protein [Salmonella enterica subsp. enterica]|nr:integrase core domain-containing protein [Salmonella enterica subsp. enterica]
MESFNGSLRDEYLNIHWFLSLEDAQENSTTGAGNTIMREIHSSLNDMTPADLSGSLRKTKIF